jgi:hypothetical protein
VKRFAIIESDSGYVWGVVDAETALAATSAQIAAAIAAHGAAKVHGAAYHAMQGGAARQALATVGLPTAGTIADLDRIGAAAFAQMHPRDRAADLMGATIRAAKT